MIDLDELRKVVDECDVFTIGFRLFAERLMIDTRTTAEEGPMIELVEPVNTVEERFFWLGKRRPAFGVPQRFTFFIWPHSVRFLGECGLMERVRERLQNAAPEVGDKVAAAVGELHRLENQAIHDAITGNNYHTLWARE